MNNHSLIHSGRNMNTKTFGEIKAKERNKDKSPLRKSEIEKRD